MAATRRKSAPRKNARKPVNAAKQKKTLANMPRQPRVALGRQAAQARQQKRAV